jgi:hypothetical protein
MTAKKRRYESSSEESEETEDENLSDWLNKSTPTPKRPKLTLITKFPTESESEGETDESGDEESESGSEKSWDTEWGWAINEPGDEEDDEEVEADSGVGDLSVQNSPGGRQSIGSELNKLFKSESAMEIDGGHQHQQSDNKHSQGKDSSLDALIQSNSAIMTQGQPQNQINSRKFQNQDSSLDAVFESQDENAPSVHQQQQSKHGSKSHSCGTDSIFESDNSLWDTLRDHSMDAEIVATYDLSDIPKMAGEIPEIPNGLLELKELGEQLPEINENDFARALCDNRDEFERDRIYWTMQLERRKVHVAYFGKLEKKREARELKKQSRSPRHEAKRLQKKTTRIRKEVERVDRSIQEKGTAAWRGNIVIGE